LAGIREKSQTLRAALRRNALPPLARDDDAAAGIVTVEIPEDVSAADVALALSEQGIQIAHESGYLRQRNWLQICLMGELDEAALDLLPGVLARHVAFLRQRAGAKPTAMVAGR
jgi:aspartate aminotransferase-like enzyme